MLICFVFIFGVLIGLTGGLRNVVHAETCTWTGNVNTDWGNTGNWSCGHIPTMSDDVVIPGGLTKYPLIKYSDIYVAYADNLTIQSGAMLLVSERLELQANNVDNYGVIKTEGMDSTYIRGDTSINNYGIINAYAGTISIHYGGTHTGIFTGQYGEISIFGDNFYPHTFSASSQILVKKISFINNTPINIEGIFSQTYPDSRVIIDNSHVTISNLTNLSIGGVTIISGSLTVSLSGTTPDAVSVPENASLVGAGTISGDLTNAGMVSPGASPGTIAVEGDYFQEATGKLNIELGGITPDTEHDQITVSGAAELGGTLQVSRIDAFAPTIGNSFTILTYASRTGMFETVNLPDLGPELDWDIDYGTTEVTLTVVPLSTGGTISGSVTYTGTKGYNTVSVGLFTDPNDPPIVTVDVDSSDGSYPYTLSELEDGTYYVGALMDLNDDDQPDPNEPFAWYDPDSNGEPDPILISSGSASHPGIDFELNDPSIIQGTVSYSGFLGITGPISVSAHLAVGDEPSATAGDIQSDDTYTIEGLPPGSYYISAYLDINQSGGPPDEGEPLAWYDQDDNGVPDLVVITVESPVQTDIDIVLKDIIFNLFLPLLTR